MKYTGPKFAIVPTTDVVFHKSFISQYLLGVYLNATKGLWVNKIIIDT